MEKKYLCIMALFDEETNKKFKEMREQLKHIGIETSSLPFHITLGAYVGVDEKELLNWLNEFCNINQRFEVNFNHVGLFSLNVSFLAPRVSKELIDFHGKLHEKYDYDCGEVGYNYSVNSKNWTPHATILIDEPEIILKALPIINDSFKPFTGQVVSLCLCEFSPMRVIKTFNLK